MIWTLLAAFLACYAVSLLVTSKRYFHMLQLESYRGGDLCKWFWNRYAVEQNTVGLVLFAAVVFLSFWGGLSYFLAGASIYCVMEILLRKRTKEKKKFVYTARVKRMYVTLGVLLLLLALLCVLLYANSSLYALRCVIAAMLLVLFSKVFFPAAVNILNRPVEKAGQSWYIKDAKRMLSEHPNLTVIGITGSYGKTSTKFFLNSLLLRKYNVLMTPRSFNTPMGVVKTIREELKSFHEIFICEMGAKYPNDIKELCDIVHPQYGILTSIGEQHLESFGSLETIVKTKFQLVDAIPGNGFSVLNYSNDLIRENNRADNVIRYGLEDESLDYWAGGIRYDKDGASFLLHSKGNQPLSLSTRLLGSHNIINLTGAAAMALELGVEPADIVREAKLIQPVPHRLELKKTGEFHIIDDAFNSNPAGFSEALTVLSQFEGQYRVLVTPGMVELGEKEYDYNFQMGKKAADCCDYAVLVGKERAVPLLDGLREAGYPEENIQVVDTIEEAFTHVRELKRDHPVLLLENDLPDTYL